MAAAAWRQRDRNDCCGDGGATARWRWWRQLGDAAVATAWRRWQRGGGDSNSGGSMATAAAVWRQRRHRGGGGGSAAVPQRQWQLGCGSGGSKAAADNYNYELILDKVIIHPIRASKKKHHAKPGGFPSRVGTRNQNSRRKGGDPQNANRIQCYVKPEGINLLRHRMSCRPASRLPITE